MLELTVRGSNLWLSNSNISALFSAAPRVPPPGVRAQNESATSIRVQWNNLPEADRNGIIIQYEVGYIYEGGPRLQANASASPLLLKNLAEDEEYKIQVRAFTSAGPGPFSQPPEIERTPEARESWKSFKCMTCEIWYNCIVQCNQAIFRINFLGRNDGPPHANPSQ